MLFVTDPRMFAHGQEASAELFARRLFRLAEVRSIEIDTVRATAAVRYRGSMKEQQIFVGRLADALTSDDDPKPEMMPKWRSGETVKLRRYGDMITLLEILTLEKSYLEVRHRAIRRNSSTTRRVVDALRQIPGLLEATLDADKLMMEFDPATTSAMKLVRCIEAELLAPPDLHVVEVAEKVDFDMANVSLGVSAISEFVLPAVMPVAAGLLVVNNLDTVRAATEQLSEGRVGLPVLYTSIAALTLLSGQFLTAAVMFWCLRSWEQRYRRDLEVENQAMLDEIVGAHAEALAINADGLEQMVPRSEIGVGQRLRVRAGERIPVDAVVIDGAALVDEARLGDPAPVTRSKGDEVLAGSRLLAGELELAASRTGCQTRAAHVSRTLIGTTVPTPGEWTLNRQAETFADSTVGPSLAAAGLGLLAGGPAMSVAVMRPDYATAEGLAVPLETLRSVRVAIRHGALIRSDKALGRLAASSWVVLEDHEELQKTDCELAEIQVRGVEEDRLFPALASAGVWLGDARGPALVRACRARHLIARRAALREIGATFVVIEYEGHVLRLSGKADPTRFAPLRVELDGVEIARLRFQRTASLAAAASVRRLQRAGLRVLLASEREASVVAPLAERLGVDQFISNADADLRRRLLRGLSERGLNVVHVHSGAEVCDSDGAPLSIALAGSNESCWNDADIVLLGRSIAPLPALAQLAHDSAARLASLRRLTMVPNLACVAGAFAFGLPSLAVVVISNLGTSTAYNRAHRALRLISRNDTLPPEAAWYAEDDSSIYTAGSSWNDSRR